MGREILKPPSKPVFTGSAFSRTEYLGAVMRPIIYYLTATIILFCCLVFKGPTAFADDTCVFMVTADNVEPNIVVLLDSGAEMQHAVWHADYADSVD